MLKSKSVLVVEDNSYVAIDLAMAIEELDGTVVGPTRTVEEALSLADAHPIAGAILDCYLDDGTVAPLAKILAKRGVPFVLHATACAPADLAKAHPDVPVLVKPLQARTILARLLLEIRREARRLVNKG